ncbi:hypothetical protein Zm00014a_021871, partial [Zea mays]
IIFWNIIFLLETVYANRSTHNLKSFFVYYLQKLKEKPEFTNPDEFYFKMINSRTVGGIHRPKPEDNKYTEEELLLLKNKDMGYILQSIQCEKRFVTF